MSSNQLSIPYVFQQLDERKIHSLTGIAFSFCIHAMIIGMMLAAVHFVPSPRPILSIDLSLLEDILPAQEFQAPKEVTQITPPPKQIIKKIIPTPKPIVTKPVPKPKPIVKEEQIVKQKIVLEVPAEIEEVSDTPLPPPVMPIASAIQNAIPKAPPVAVRQKNPQERYLTAHFLYIKKDIQKSIDYPKMARRMGWEGKVILSFIICESGAVTDIKVVKSSGYAILDKNAVAAIKLSAPFPKPPVRAELTVPISYRLS